LIESIFLEPVLALQPPVEPNFIGAEVFDKFEILVQSLLQQFSAQARNHCIETRTFIGAGSRLKQVRQISARLPQICCELGNWVEYGLIRIVQNGIFSSVSV
jgi:hypothetical protein